MDSFLQHLACVGVERTIKTEASSSNNNEKGDGRLAATMVTRQKVLEASWVEDNVSLEAVDVVDGDETEEGVAFAEGY